ncbi:hypothetical protein P8452_47314 [Trifolium repens]|nr:paired amphipathic helix protein Sin3 [Trifolium repens]WJX62307.1 hypothetical protein P8452_47314 [Trifolium repens]
MSGSSSANIKSTDDILAYLNEINDAFKDEVQKFDDFIGVMSDFKEKRIDVEGVVSRVKELFKEHEELLLKFNDYVPEKYKRMSGSSSANIKSTDDILAYLNEINDAFKDEVQKFDDFRGVMRDFKEKRIDVEGVVSRVKELFKEHEELLLKFNDYLPEEYKVSLE